MEADHAENKDSKDSLAALSARMAKAVEGVGPAIVTAAEDDNAVVVDCTGMTVVPAVVDIVALAGGRGRRPEYVATLTPGNAADFLVVPDELVDLDAGLGDTLREVLDRRRGRARPASRLRHPHA